MEYPKDCLYVWVTLVTLKHLKQYIERKESFLQRRYMLHFIASSILSGIIWDIMKGTPKVVQRYFLKKNEIDEGKLENLIASIPQNEKNSKDVLVNYLKSDEEYQILVNQVVYKLQKAHKRKAAFLLIAIVCLLGVFFYCGNVMDSEKNLRTFVNSYIEVTYNGLQKKENVSVNEGGDTYFYNNIWDLKNKKYIRVVKLPVTTELHLDTGLLPDSYDWEYISDSCQSQELWMCLRYANSELGFSEKNEAFYEHFSYKMLEENSGFLLVHAIEVAKYLENVKNTVFIKYTDSDYKYFILGKCLYADADGYMMALLSYSGLSYEDFVDSTDKKVVRMRKCFDSIRQINYNGESMQIGNE